MTTTSATTSIRVSSALAAKLDEIVRLTKTRTSTVCDRLFAEAADRELSEVRRREMSRLAAEKQGE